MGAGKVVSARLLERVATFCVARAPMCVQPSAPAPDVPVPWSADGTAVAPWPQLAGVHESEIALPPAADANLARAPWHAAEAAVDGSEAAEQEKQEDAAGSELEESEEWNGDSGGGGAGGADRLVVRRSDVALLRSSIEALPPPLALSGMGSAAASPGTSRAASADADVGAAAGSRGGGTTTFDGAAGAGGGGGDGALSARRYGAGAGGARELQPLPSGGAPWESFGVEEAEEQLPEAAALDRSVAADVCAEVLATLAEEACARVPAVSAGAGGGVATPAEEEAAGAPASEAQETQGGRADREGREDRADLGNEESVEQQDAGKEGEEELADRGLLGRAHGGAVDEAAPRKAVEESASGRTQAGRRRGPAGVLRLQSPLVASGTAVADRVRKMRACA